MIAVAKIQHVHIVGVGGAGTSGLARLLQARGVKVTGSELMEGESLASLRAEGMRVWGNHRAANVSPQVDLVVHSAAVPRENHELAEARRRGIPICKYAEFLGRLLGDEYGIAVAGTHGKTTTAGMLASIFLAAGRNPSVLIGGIHPDLGGNCRHGPDPEFIVEACEYDRSFLALKPHAGIITNLELDHPEIYPSENELLRAFQSFVARFQPGGLLLVHGDSTLLRRVAPPLGVRRVTFGLGPHCQWRARVHSCGAQPSFQVWHEGREWGRIDLTVPGPTSVHNALAACALAAELGLPPRSIAMGLASFPGIERRFQRRGSVAGVELVDDYAHHPTEVAGAITTAREVFPGRRLWAVFQPHQFGRLQAYGPGFAEALQKADQIALLPVYSVREDPSAFPLGLLDQFAQRLAARVPMHRLSSLEAAQRQLLERLTRGDVCLCLGAGDVYKLTAALGKSLGRPREKPA
ncbi:MAG: UDP-N-acetylmuramate--L-alanine ligase [Planctomycetota bacterium]